MQKHGLKIGVGVVSLIILIATIVMLTGKKEEEPDLSPSPSAAAKAIAFLQNTDQSDIDGTADEETPPPAFSKPPPRLTDRPGIGPPPSEESDIDGTAVQPNPDEEAIARALAAVQPASTVETYMMVPGTKPPLDYTRFTSS
jgi:hypothetical protein